MTEDGLWAPDDLGGQETEEAMKEDLWEAVCQANRQDGSMLLSAYRAGAGCRLSQADAAWVRNVIADSENFLPDLLREVP